MKLTVIINDSYGIYLEAMHTGVIRQPKRRSVEIELTEEQMKDLDLQVIGNSRGQDMYEEIESVSIKLDK